MERIISLEGCLLRVDNLDLTLSKEDKRVQIHKPFAVNLRVEGDAAIITSDDKMYLHTARSLISSAVTGLGKGWSRTVELIGTGYEVRNESGRL
ncbi:MAG: hypothetical protein GY771_08575, partial [bacterium]|nr:hypothetical protein [bacterium]